MAKTQINLNDLKLLLEQLPIFLDDFPNDNAKIEELLRPRMNNESIWSRIMVGDLFSNETKKLFTSVLKSLKDDNAKLKLLKSFFYSDEVRKSNPKYDHSSLHHILLKSATKSTEYLDLITNCLNNKKSITNVLEMLDSGAYDCGNTILHSAAATSHAALLSTLHFLQSIFSPKDLLAFLKIKNMRGNTVLHEISKATGFPEQQIESFKLILNLYPNEYQKNLAVQSRNKKDETALHLFASDEKITQEILSLFDITNKKSFIAQTDIDGNTALHCVKNSVKSLEQMLDCYPLEEDKLNALMQRNEDKETVLIVLGQKDNCQNAFFTALSYCPKKERHHALFKRNKLGEALYTLNPAYTKKIIEQLENPEGVDSFLLTLDQIEKKEKKLQLIKTSFLPMLGKINELYDYGIKLQSSSNESRKKAGKSAIQLSNDIKLELINYYSTADETNRRKALNNLRAVLLKGYKEMSEYRNMGFIHHVLYIFTKLLTYCFVDPKKAAIPKMGENTFGYFAKTSRQKLVEEIDKTISMAGPF